MKWWVFILLPFQLFAQETYTNCGDIVPQNYQVSYDVDKVYYWDISEGAAFTEFDPEVHIIPPFEIPIGWELSHISESYLSEACRLHVEYG